MPKIIVVYDDLDPHIGSNTLLCYTHLQKSINVSHHTIVPFDGANCNCTSIQQAIIDLQEVPFVFIAYSHGSQDCLSSYSHGEYVNVSNSYYFSASLFYTNACLSALSLKEMLLAQNCRVFIGYNDEVKVPDQDDLEELFVECENHAITLFLNTNLNIGECFGRMKDMYDAICDKLVDQGEIAWASKLALNRSCLVIDGDLTTTRLSYV